MNLQEKIDLIDSDRKYYCCSDLRSYMSDLIVRFYGGNHWFTLYGKTIRYCPFCGKRLSELVEGLKKRIKK